MRFDTNTKTLKDVICAWHGCDKAVRKIFFMPLDYNQDIWMAAKPEPWFLTGTDPGTSLYDHQSWSRAAPPSPNPPQMDPLIKTSLFISLSIQEFNTQFYLSETVTVFHAHSETHCVAPLTTYTDILDALILSNPQHCME